jgi:hypothetical protein
MKATFTLLLIFITTGCASLLALPPAAEEVKDVPACASIPNERAYIRAIYDQVQRDEVMPPSGKLALASLWVGRPTFAFRNNEGAVLKFDILDYPGSTEAYQATASLMHTGLRAAKEFELCLSGIEVVFYEDKRRLRMVFRAVPPWRAKDISLVPLGRRGD